MTFNEMNGPRPVDHRETEATARKQAVEFLYKTLGEEPGSVEQFPDRLFAEIENLPRFQEALKAVQGVEQKDLPLALFKVLQPRAGEQDDRNGVLIDSMKSGALHCAGRASIGSRVLSKMGIEHYYAKPPGHSMLILKLSPDTLGYFDANNNVFFTFPKEALVGLTDEPLSECRLEDYQIRAGDWSFGDGSAMRHMMLLDGDAGILHSYLGNAGAALSGNTEFAHDAIPQNQAAADAMTDIKKQLLGESLIPDQYFIDGEKEQEQAEIESSKLRELILSVAQRTTSKEDFSAQLIDSQELWSKFPYRQSVEQKSEYLDRLYQWVTQKG